MVRRIVAKNKIDCEHLLGHFIDESHYDVVIEEDTDRKSTRLNSSH